MNLSFVDSIVLWNNAIARQSLSQIFVSMIIFLKLVLNFMLQFLLQNYICHIYVIKTPNNVMLGK